MLKTNKKQYIFKVNKESNNKTSVTSYLFCRKQVILRVKCFVTCLNET